MVKSPPEGIEYFDPSEGEEEAEASSSSAVTDQPTGRASGVTYSGGSSVSEIYAKISGPEETPFEGGKFLMKLVLSADYPNSPPRGYFLTKIYHPNVAPNGDICVNTLKKDWVPDTTLKHILQVIRCLLIVPFPESSLNDEAGKLFMESYDEFARRARIMTEVHAEQISHGDSGVAKLAVYSLAADAGSTSTAATTAAGGSVTAKGAKKAKDAKTKSLKRL